MRRGARSIRGAMGAYALAAAVAVAALGVVLWLAWPRDTACWVQLPADSAWTHAVVDDGAQEVAVGRGERARLVPGEYRLTLLGEDGASEQRPLRVQGALTLLGR